MAHSHDHSTLEVSLHTRRVLTAIAVGMAVIIVVGMILLWPPARPVQADKSFLIDNVLGATVTAVGTGPCSGTNASEDITCLRVRFRLTQGPDSGTSTNQEFPLESAHPDLSVGDDVVLSYQKGAEPGFAYSYADRQRRPVLWALALVFAIVVVALGRLRGLSALAGLFASLVVIVRFILPGILDGQSPVLVAVIGAGAIVYLALYMSTGFNSLTTVALLGTISALAVTVGLSVLFTELANFSGRTSDETIVLELASGRIQLGGLILASIVIGALGALDDVTVTQASAVAELRAANPDMGRVALMASGLRIGRDHIASTVNTLALAYVGASLPTMLLFMLAGQSLGAVANGEVVAVEIVRTLVGSIGLVASVPITTWLAVVVVSGPSHDGPRRPRRRPRPPAPTGPPAPEPEPVPAAASGEVTGPPRMEDPAATEAEFWKK